MAQVTRYVNTASSGGDGTTNDESGATAAYASLSAWEAAEQGDLTAAGRDEQHLVLCSTGTGSAADTTSVTINGWTTDATHHITVRGNAATGDYAGSSWDTSKYRLEGGSGNHRLLSFNGGFFEGLQIGGYTASRANLAGIQVSSAGAEVCGIEDVFVYYSPTTWASGADFTGIHCDHQSVGVDAYVVNCIVVIEKTDGGTVDADFVVGMRLEDRGGSGSEYRRFFNNTVYIDGVRSSSASSAGMVLFENGQQDLWRNLLSYVNDGGGANTIECFTSTFGTPDGDYCASSDGTAPGSNSRTSQTFTFAGAPTDMALDAADAGAKGFGVDLSGDAGYPFSTDIDGNDRGATWDIGAHQVSVAAPAYPDGSMQRVYRARVA